MNNSYLLEIQKWIRIFHLHVQKAGMPMTRAEAVYLRRRNRTNPSIPPERVLGDLIDWGIITLLEGETSELLTLSKLGESWIADMHGDTNYALLKAHKHIMAEKILSKRQVFLEVKVLFDQLSRLEDGQICISDAKLNSIHPKIVDLLLTLEVIVPVDSTYYLVPEFHYLLAAAEKSKPATSEEELLNRLEKRREIGKMGEIWVEHYESYRIERLYPGYQHDIERVSEKNVSLGYDVYSKVHPSIEERCIEVKTTTGDNIHFFLTSNELEVAKDLRERYWIYVLVGMGTNRRPKKLYCLQNPHQFFSKHNIKSLPALYEVSIPEDKCQETSIVGFLESTSVE